MLSFSHQCLILLFLWFPHFTPSNYGLECKGNKMRLTWLGYLHASSRLRIWGALSYRQLPAATSEMEPKQERVKLLGQANKQCKEEENPDTCVCDFNLCTIMALTMVEDTWANVVKVQISLLSPRDPQQPPQPCPTQWCAGHPFRSSAPDHLDFGWSVKIWDGRASVWENMTAQWVSMEKKNPPHASQTSVKNSFAISQIFLANCS